MVYLIKDSLTGYIKIGKSKHPQKRLAQLQTGTGGKLVLLQAFDVENDLVVEKRLHQMFWKSRKRGEWFHFPSEDYISFIVSFIGELLTNECL